MSKRIISILIFQIWGLINYAQSKIVVNARAVNGVAMVRWAPTESSTWLIGNANGYHLISRAIDSNGENVSQQVFGPIFPLSEAEWQPFIENDNYAGLAHQLLYKPDVTEYVGPFGALEKQDMEINRFNFALFAADLSFQTAVHMGLGAVDVSFSNQYTYEYQVYIKDKDDFISSDIIKLDPLNQPDLPTPDSLIANFSNQQVELRWLRGDLDQYYSAYNVEIMDPNSGNTSFQVVNEFPYVYMTPEIEIPGVDVDHYLFFRDSLEKNFTEYTFRVLGISPFGEIGPPSNEVVGSGKPDPLPVTPLITRVAENIDQEIEIEWRIKANYQDSIKGFNIYRSLNNKENFIRLNQGLLAPSELQFLDEHPDAINYYQIEVIDLFDHSIFSVVSLGQLNDLEAPVPPIGLQGMIDTLGRVNIHWNPNQEPDVLGYHIYFSHTETGEYSLLTSGNILRDTIYQDSVLSTTLSETIFYKLRAIDFRGNQSAYSDPLQVVRPDLVPPVQAVFKVNNTDKVFGTIEFEYVNSSSGDVVRNELQRKKVTATNWETLRIDSIATKGGIKFEDKTAEVGEQYQYRIVSEDDAGHITFSDTFNIETFDPPITDATITNFSGTTQGESISISWDYGIDLPIKKVILYRVEGPGPLRTYKHLQLEDLKRTGNSFEYKDLRVEPGKRYRYQFTILHENEQNAPLSKVLGLQN